VPHRDGTDQVESAERDAAAAQLRRDGLGYRDIAARQGISTAAAFYRVERALRATRREPGEQILQLERERLDRLEAEAVDVLQAEHLVVSAGRIITDGDGVPLVDHAPRLAAVRTLLAIAERRARLLGLDAPTRTELTVATLDEVDREIAELQLELDRRHALAAGSTPPLPFPEAPAGPSGPDAGAVADAVVAGLTAAGMDPDQVDLERVAAAVETALGGQP
jgi:hypothetical protein